MKTKSLFFALALLITVSSPMWAGAIVPDEIVPSDLNSEIGLIDGDYKLFSEATGNVISSSNYMGISSDAEYVGQIGYNASNDVIFLNNKHILATRVPGGRAKTVTITWGGSAAGNTTKSQIQVYAGTTAFVGNENKTGVTDKGAKLVTTLKWEAAGDEVINLPSGTTHVAIVGASSASYLEYISVDWEEITYYSVSVNPGLAHGSIALSKTLAEEGESVSMTITPDMGYELRRYSYNSTVVNLPEAEYTIEPKTVYFAMPNANVVVSATFALVPERDLSDFYFYASSSDMAADNYTDEITITSGENYTVYFETDPPYNGNTLDFSIANADNAVIVSHTYNPMSGEGSVVLKGYAVGETTLTITAAQTALFDKAVGEVTIVVEPKQVVLVTEYEGRAFAATTTLIGSDLAAQEVVIANGNVYYDPAGTYNLAAMTWNMETRIVNEEELLALTNASGEYLRTMTSSAYQFQATFYAWVLEGGRLSSANTKGIKYSNSAGVFKAVSFYENGADFSASVYPVSVSTLSTVTTYSRSQKADKYATICFPFAASTTLLSGVEEIYNITGKIISGGDVKGIEMELVEDVVLEEGKPYVILTNSTTLSVKYGAKTTMATTGNATGLVGNMAASPVDVPVDCYGFSNNLLRKVVYEGTASISQYKAYVDLTYVDVVGGASPAPGRRVIYTENTATSVEDLLENATLINWDEPVYNALGQRVGKGTTGVLIQNGQKSLIQ